MLEPPLSWVCCHWSSLCSLSFLGPIRWSSNGPRDAHIDWVDHKKLNKNLHHLQGEVSSKEWSGSMLVLQQLSLFRVNLVLSKPRGATLEFEDPKCRVGHVGWGQRSLRIFDLTRMLPMHAPNKLSDHKFLGIISLYEDIPWDKIFTIWRCHTAFYDNRMT